MPVRPPHTLPESQFIDACTRCEKCITACPTDIIVKGSGGFPEIDFAQGEGLCELCEKCADACPDNAFEEVRESPWPWHIALDEQTCLAHKGITCRTCAEQCDQGAIRIRPQLGGVFIPNFSLDACNGCGACLAPCPVDAISIKR
nr:ferredoxin-type protein NapF [Echinimonas agarilytica]